MSSSHLSHLKRILADKQSSTLTDCAVDRARKRSGRSRFQVLCQQLDSMHRFTGSDFMN